MAMVINSNIMSLNAQRNLMISQGDQNQAMERLSSGKRINSAADDAAGLAISNRMTSQVRGLDQAVRNANDGISLIQTAEGALDETTNILQRMRELSIQSANGTYSDGNRSTINAEVQQLKAEMDRISETTSFNGLNILDGTLGEVGLHVGENANQVIALEIGKMDTDSLGGGGADIIGQAVTQGTGLLGQLQAGLSAAAAQEMRINGQDVLASGNITSTGITLQGALDVMNSNLTGVEVGTYLEMDATTEGTGVISGTDELTLTMAMADGTTNTIDIRNTGSLEELADKINAQAGGLLQASVDDAGMLSLTSDSMDSLTIGGTGGTAEVLGSGLSAAAVEKSALTITSLDGKPITVDYGSGSIGSVIGVDEREVAGELKSLSGFTLAAFDAGDMNLNGVEIGSFSLTTDYEGGTAGDVGTYRDLAAFINTYSDQTNVVASANTVTEVVTLQSLDGSEISIDYRDGTTETDMRAAIGFRETNHTSGAGGNVAGIDVSSVAGANKAIGIIDKALEQVNSLRGDLGAVNNRLDFTINNLSNVSENVAAARSRIEDADFAAESAALSRAQVLQQAGTAMLAQANAAPQQVLSLLQ